MEELKLERKFRQVSLYGKVYKLSSPTVKQTLSFQKEIKEMDEDKVLESLSAVLASLGLPKEALEEMEVEHISTLSEFLFGGKKN